MRSASFQGVHRTLELNRSSKPISTLFLANSGPPSMPVKSNTENVHTWISSKYASDVAVLPSYAPVETRLSYGGMFDHPPLLGAAVSGAWARS